MESADAVAEMHAQLYHTVLSHNSEFWLMTVLGKVLTYNLKSPVNSKAQTR